MWSDSRKKNKTRWLRATLGIWLAVVMSILWWLAPLFPTVVDALYSAMLFPLLAGLAASITRNISVSTLEATIFLTLFVLPLLLLILALRKSSVNRLGLVWGVGRGVLAWTNYAAWILVLFVFLWGFNHWRTPLPEVLDLSKYPLTVEQQKNMLQRAAVHTNKVAVQVDSVCAMSPITQFDNAPMQAWLDANELPSSVNAYARPMALSSLAARLQISGVYNPFLFQPTYSLAQHPMLTVFTAQHEFAHLAGWAGEQEASLAAYAAAWTSDDSFLQYAAWLNFWRATGERGNLAADVLDDLRCIDQYQQVFKPLPVADEVWQVYDGYLQAAGGEGLKDYAKGEHFALLYFWYKLARN